MPTSVTSADPGTSSPKADSNAEKIGLIQVHDDGSQHKIGKWTYEPIDNGPTAAVKFAFVVFDQDDQPLDEGCYTDAIVKDKAGAPSAEGKERNGCTLDGWDSFRLPVGSYTLTVTARIDGAILTQHQDFEVI
ncbi:hypothetical protein AB0I51_47545 [Streptomyces sp. NPDC050549]|uniref:hypothetical protein n=1 Tax=Streptomyces sp. NPDC050549 TaxID=3155406 RepID=UPI003433765F